jgi:hypothetical protein
MGELLSVILHDYHNCHGIFALPLAALILFWRRWRGLRFAVGSRKMTIVAIGLAGLVLATYLGILVQRQLGVMYGDHLEALVASISWLVVHGRPGYPDWRDGDLYGDIYGPLLYWINGLALLISPTIIATKLAAAGALVLGLLSLWGLASRTISGWPMRLLLAALLVEQLLPYRFTAYWIRSEPFLYILAALAILAGARLKPVVAITTVGLLAGLAVDLKIHGILYMLPVGLLVLARARDGRRMAVFVAASALAALAALIAPVLADPSVVLLYTRYLALAAGHGFSAPAVIENLEIAAALAAPAFMFFQWRRPVLTKDDLWFLTGLALATLVVIVLGSKVGALPNYLLPLAPSFFYLTVSTMAAPPRHADRPDTQLGLTAIAFLIVFACNAGSWLLMVQTVPKVSSYNVVMTAKRAEFIALLAAHPDAETGIGDDASYEDTYFAPLQVMRNGMLHIAVPAWMDLREGGISESYALRFIEGCAVPAWILPAGAPFSVVTPYTNQPLFSDAFRAAFAKNYGLADHGVSYDIWVCRAGGR